MTSPLVREAKRLRCRAQLAKIPGIRSLFKKNPGECREILRQHGINPDLGMYCLGKYPPQINLDLRPGRPVRMWGELWNVLEMSGQIWLENRKGELVQP